MLLRFSPEERAHTAAEGRSTACKLVKIPSFNLRGEFLWRGGPLTLPRRFLALSAAKSGAKGRWSP